MEKLDYYVLMSRYNRWMNRKCYDICAQMTDEERKRDRGAFFKSIHGTLNHLMYGDKVWMGRFLERPFKAIMGQELHESFDAMRGEREVLDQSICAWAGTLDRAWLSAPFTFVSGVDGRSRTGEAWILVTHMFNHQTHHRGQLTTLLKQAGRDPGVTDIPWMPELAL